MHIGRNVAHLSMSLGAYFRGPSTVTLCRITIPILVTFILFSFVEANWNITTNRNKTPTNLYEVYGIQNDEKGSDLTEYALAPKAAKSVLRERRGFGWIGEKIEEGRESLSGGETNDELNRACPNECWGPWSSYGPCSATCGARGTQSSIRSEAPSTRCRLWVATHDCPGSGSRSRSCNRFCYNGGTISSSLFGRECSCRSGFTGTCCETSVTCGSAGNINHGSVTPLLPHYGVGARVTYRCDVGYILQGASARLCEPSGRWSGTQPGCRLVVCVHPGVPANGETSIGPFPFQSNLTFFCISGYILEGPSQRTCQADGHWSGTQPFCRRVVCSSTDDISHGTVTPYSDSRVRYYCDVGYYLVGASVRRCLPTESWDLPEPRCQVVDCGDPGVPENGVRAGVDYTYGRIVTFSCRSGYILEGPSQLECRADGYWSDRDPICRRVTCNVPQAPDHGSVTPNFVVASGEQATYTCYEGYYLVGTAVVACGLDGRWSSGQPTCTRISCDPLSPVAHGDWIYSSMFFDGMAHIQCHRGYQLATGHTSDNLFCSRGTGTLGRWVGPTPTCEAVSCGDPGGIVYGVQDASEGFTYGAHLVYMCEAGYVMVGTSILICEYRGYWSGATPQCIVCPLNYYKEGVNVQSVCTPCPSNSYTTTLGSTSKLQCICDFGYTTESSDGECVVVRCPELTALPNTIRQSCGTLFRQRCEFACEKGYIWAAGDIRRVCEINGNWSGSPLQCQACPVNQYEIFGRICVLCPEDSHTVGTGSSRDDCICDEGFSPIGEGPRKSCRDVDECQHNDGGCQQVCVNTPGSYSCECNLPGFIKSAENTSRCVPRNECDELEPVANGGLVCSLQPLTNTQRCEVLCNHGYEHLTGPNAHEECGPSTDWKWTTELTGLPLFDCQLAIYEGVQLEIDIFYFVSSCSNLNVTQKELVKREFLLYLIGEDVCTSSGILSCHLDDVTLRCGATTRRRRRQTAMEELVLSFRIDVDDKNATEVDCQLVCDREDMSSRYCNRTCETNYNKRIREEIMQQISNIGGVETPTILQTAPNSDLPLSIASNTGTVQEPDQQSAPDPNIHSSMPSNIGAVRPTQQMASNSERHDSTLEESFQPSNVETDRSPSLPTTDSGHGLFLGGLLLVPQNRTRVSDSRDGD